jgi:hypothetical protein
MRADVRRILDDNDSERFSDDDAVNLAIYRAATIVGRTLADKSWPALISNTVIAVTNGQASIPANEKILNVHWSSDSVGTSLYPIRQGDTSVRFGTSPLTGFISVDYVAKFVEPATDSDPVTYCGADVDDYTVDALCACIAAEDLKLAEQEPIAGIKEKIKTLEADILRARTGALVSPVYTQKYHNYETYRWYQPTGILIKVIQ